MNLLFPDSPILVHPEESEPLYDIESNTQEANKSDSNDDTNKKVSSQYYFPFPDDSFCNESELFLAIYDFLPDISSNNIISNPRLTRTSTSLDDLAKNVQGARKKKEFLEFLKPFSGKCISGQITSIETIATSTTLEDFIPVLNNHDSQGTDMEDDNHADNIKLLQISFNFKLKFIVNDGDTRRKMPRQDNVLKDFRIMSNGKKVERNDYYLNHIIKLTKCLLRIIFRIRSLDISTLRARFCKKAKYEISLDLKNESQTEVFNFIVNLAQNEQDCLKRFSKAKDDTDANYSINGEWIDRNFQNETIREFYKLAVCYIFIGKSIPHLKEILKISCCNQISDCSCDFQQWVKLYQFSIENLVHCQIEYA